MNLNNESIESLQIIYNKIYYNGYDLLNDGIFLLENNRLARAYLCFQIAIEEFSKLFMINTVAIKIYNNEKVDWKNLNRRMRSHQKKNAMSIVMKDFFYSHIRENFKNPEGISVQELKQVFTKFKELLMHNPKMIVIQQYLIISQNMTKSKDEMENEIELKNNMKNHSLYADFREKSFITPNEFFSGNDVKEIMIEALFQHWTLELSDIHNNGFIFYKKEITSNRNGLDNFIMNHIISLENMIETQNREDRDK